MPLENKQVLGPDRNFALGTDGIESDAGAGTKNGDTVSVYEMGVGDSSIHRSRFTLASTPVKIADEAGVVGHGGVKLYDFPTGRIKVIGAIAALSITKVGDGISATFDSDFSLGSAVASNNATLTGSECDIIPSTSIAQAVKGVASATGASLYSAIAALTDSSTGTSGGNTVPAISDINLSTSNAYTDSAVNTAVNALVLSVKNAIATLAAKQNAVIGVLKGDYAPLLDGSVTAKDLYLNFLIDDADQAGGSLLVTGTVEVLWVNLDAAA